MKLVYEFTVSGSLEERVIGRGPYGTRVIVKASGGLARGERINGTIVGAAGD
ncbi:MAG: DUF3237 family protein [Burkholderiaceae bacterium]|nr:DUF3237 family protein [Burkholderiaceae bacterium]